MKRDYVIVSLDTSGTSPAKGNHGNEMIALEMNLLAGFDLRVKAMDDAEAKHPSINTSTIMTVDSIPMRLIQPFDEEDNGTSINSDNITWGVEAVGAHTSPFDGKGINVAILDTGIDIDHECFDDIRSRIIQKDFTGEGDGDPVGHGTHVAGTICGKMKNGTRIGVAPGIENVLIGKVLGQDGRGSTNSILKGIQWAVENGAHIISMSLGMDFTRMVRFLHEERGIEIEPATSIALEGYRKNVQMFESLAQFISTSSQQPVLFIAAAGNESKRPDFEIAVSPPAIARGFISVGALGQNGSGLSVARFSNTGPILSGPGVGILSAQAGNKSGLTSKSGTSMATPHVAGVAALWAQKLVEINQLTVSQLESKLKASCESQGLPADQFFDFGGGIVRAPQD